MKTSCLLLFVVLLPGAAAGQAKADPFDVHCGDIRLLQAKPVQAELKVTEAQRKRLNIHAQWHSGQLQALDSDMRTKKINPQQANVNGKLEGLFKELKGRVLKELTVPQVKRLREVTLQQIGEAALCDPIVAKRLKVSDAQLSRLQSTYRQGAEAFNAREQAEASKVLAPYKGRQPKDQAEADKLRKEVQGKMAAASAKVKPALEAIRSSFRTKMRAILDKPQLAAFEALKGMPFRA